MSDNNDKKPTSPHSGWPTPNDPARQGQPVGQAIEDPLAELDRIVNQDFGLSGRADGRSASVSSEDLRILEQELIRELRGHQMSAEPAETSETGYVPAEPVAPAPAPAPTVAPVQETVSEQLSRPHPLAPAAHRPAAPAPVEPRVEAPAVPVATMPTSDAVAEPAQRAPSLDDWSSLIGGADAGKPAAPAPTESVATSGSYGQLSRPAQPVHQEAPAVAADPVATEHRYASETDYRAAPAQPAERVAPAAPEPSVAAPRAPEVAAPEASVSDTWNEIVSRQAPVVDPSPDYRQTAEDAVKAAVTQELYAAPETVYSEATPSVEHDAYAGAPVPEVNAPIESDPATDPYAAFNQTPADPYAGYNDLHAGAAGTAPTVDVSGQGANYAAADPYQDGAQYADPSQAAYDQGYQTDYAAQNGAVGSDYPMASGPHGTYADPGVAYAAAESSPYLQDEDYQTLDTEAAIAAGVQPRKSRKGLIAALAAVGIIAVGGLIAWGFGSSDGGDTETPMLTADNSPVKETPDDPGGKIIPHQNKTVYDRIDGTESDEGPSNLMPAGETPLALTADGQTPRVISLSVPQNSNAVAPKTVRTVVVRPDGTIVNTDAADAKNAQAESLDSQILNTTPSEQAMTQTFNNGIDGASTSTGLGLPNAQSTNQATSPLPREKPAELVALQAAARNIAAPVVQQTQTQSAQTPLVLAPPTQQAVAPVSNNTSGNTSGGYTVQVTSQRSQEQARASFNSIQAQLPSVLAGYQPDIKAADLGARGTYYRVRVGSFADRAGATSFCSSIKAAGGDCLVARK